MVNLPSSILNSIRGFSLFLGESAVTSSTMILVSREGGGYTDSPYGSKGGLSYGISASITQIYRSNFIIGVDLGYELLRSNVEITEVYATTGFNSLPASGQTYLNNNSINVFPNIGYRLALKTVLIDFSGGMDIAYCLSAEERGSAEAGTRKYRTQRDRKTISTDLRSRIQANVNRGKYGVYVGCSTGLRNYKSDFVGGVNEAYSRLVRFGVTYRSI